MYLKALELQGFKSFPEKTRISFDREVTAIVGPNGSGKSNISDALLWVMGEQRTKALRGGKMEDVIFGGTEKRSPMGFAQVSLVLDNSRRLFDRDCDEITISRRYYRSGESEYSINRETVRLRDVTELLMDTGLGRDGYSIIGQGRIAEIVSAKSTDRREIFEEAAGISRFRYRKEESERRLARTEENLVRIGDKISELELQVEPLRQQSELAKKYLLLRDELRVKEISLWMENLDRLHDQSEVLRSDYAEAVSLRDQARAALDALYAAAEELSETMHSCELQMEELRTRQREEEAGAAQLESESAVLRTNIQNSDAAVERLERELSELSGRADSLNAQIEEHRSRLEAIASELIDLALRERELKRESEQTESGLSEHNSILSALVLEESEYKSSITESRSAESVLQETLAGYGERRGSLADEIAAAGENRERCAAKLAEAKKTLTEAQNLVTKTANMVSGRSMLLQKREAAFQELVERKESLTAELRGMDSRLSLLQELEKEYEGFNKAVKTVMREAERSTLRGVHGPVARLIRTEERYAVAVEIALGAAAQNIIVDTQRDGRNAIELLKRREGGRATFLPLDTIRPSSLSRPPREDAGFVAMAAELVECDGQYRDVVSSLLGRVVITETLEDAVRIGNKNNNTLRIVSLDGQQVNVGGSMTGGSVGKSTGILSRANELKELTAKRAEAAAELEQVMIDGKEAQRKREALRQELEAAREENSDARAAVSRAEGALAQSELLTSAAESAEEALRKEQSSLDERERDCRSRIETLLAKCAEAETSLHSVQEKIERESSSASEVEQARRAIEEKRSYLRERNAALESEKNSVTAACEQLIVLREDMEGQSGGSRTALKLAREQGASLREQLALKERQLAERRAHIEELAGHLRSKTEEKLSIEARRVSRDKEAQQKNNELLERERVCAGLEQKKQAAELEEKTIVDKLWDSYELSRSAAQTLRQPLESYSKAQKQVSELRRSMNALGNPNLGAIEEYQRVSERYTFLSEQRADVEKSKAEIEGIIRDITENMEKIFKERFAEIDTAFRATFLELFGGGKAALSLEDENNVLECGIEIRIQPPGKALSNISLLSGGEKAFVAIALYFAIMKVRPTPFCVMDEIESALDEANVAIFADYLRRMSDETQFIVITHRRGSMEGADELFGVTMQEKGVSTVLQMDMTEAMKSISN